MFSTLLADLRMSVRTLWQRPGFALGGILTLAIGIGANTAVFSVIYGVLLRPLPYPNPDRLVVLWETNAERGFDRMNVAPPNLQDWIDASDTFEGIGGYASGSDVLPGPDGGLLVRFARMTPPVLSALGATPLTGRVLQPADGMAGAPRVIVLSEAFWRQRFDADPAIVGRTIAFRGDSYDVVGVMPATFSFPPPVSFEAIKRPVPADAYVALREDDLMGRTAHYLIAIGRMKPGVALAAAEDQLQVIASRLATEYPENTGWSVRLVPLDEGIVGEIRPALLVLLGGVAIVLLLACANTAHLLLARALDRRREMAVRIALGASRSRLAGQLLVEGLVLAVAGGAAGLLLASWGVRLLIAAAPAALPRLGEIQIDRWTLAATAAAALLAAVLSSLAPIAHAFRQRTITSLRERGAASAASAGLMRRLLIAGEAAMAVVLVAVSVLVGQSFLALRGVDTGFTADNVLMFHLRLAGDAYGTGEQQTAFLEEALARIEALPGVVAAGTIDSAPLADDRQGTSFEIEGRLPYPQGAEPTINFAFVSPGYFEAMQIDLMQGRRFTPADRRDTLPVTIISETFARKHFPNENPIGQRVALGFNSQTLRTIVGVVDDERHEALTGDVREAAYTPVYQVPLSSYAVAVRAEGDPEPLAGPVRRAIAAMDRNLAVYDVSPMSAVVSESLGTSRFSAQLITIFAGVALLLAIVGVYSVASHTVASRRMEMGVRIALGAAPRNIIRVVLVPALGLASLGVAAGLAATAAASRLVASALTDVSPLAPSAYLLAGVTVLVATAAATWVPARRASRTDPLDSLRAE